MFGHGCPLEEPDPGVGVVLDDAAGAADPVDPDDPAVADVVDVLCAAGAAEALVMPAAAPPVASAPAIIVAPSIFETFI
jgi:hypothetical protein